MLHNSQNKSFVLLYVFKNIDCKYEKFDHSEDDKHSQTSESSANSQLDRNKQFKPGTVRVGHFLKTRVKSQSHESRLFSKNSQKVKSRVTAKIFFLKKVKVTVVCVDFCYMELFCVVS